MLPTLRFNDLTLSLHTLTFFECVTLVVYHLTAGGLRIVETERKLVSTDVWAKLRTYFPNAPEFTQNQEPCQQCMVIAHTSMLELDVTFVSK